MNEVLGTFEWLFGLAWDEDVEWRELLLCAVEQELLEVEVE